LLLGETRSCFLAGAIVHRCGDQGVSQALRSPRVSPEPVSAMSRAAGKNRRALKLLPGIGDDVPRVAQRTHEDLGDHHDDEPAADSQAHPFSIDDSACGTFLP